MAGANIFVIYADAGSTNVTLSPRLGKGHVEPLFNQDAEVFLLEGSGIKNGQITANVRCTFSTANSELSFKRESKCNNLSQVLIAVPGLAGAWILLRARPPGCGQ